jgi:hypothetical protein
MKRFWKAQLVVVLAAGAMMIGAARPAAAQTSMIASPYSYPDWILFTLTANPWLAVDWFAVTLTGGPWTFDESELPVFESFVGDGSFTGFVMTPWDLWFQSEIGAGAEIGTVSFRARMADFGPLADLQFDYAGGSGSHDEFSGRGVVVVSEPPGILLLASGLMALFAMMRRRRYQLGQDDA